METLALRSPAPANGQVTTDPLVTNEALGASGHAAAACGFPVRVVELLWQALGKPVVQDKGQGSWSMTAPSSGQESIILSSLPEFFATPAGTLHAFQPLSTDRFLYGLVNDRTTTSRQQLRVYVVRESDLRNLPEAQWARKDKGAPSQNQDAHVRVVDCARLWACGAVDF